MKCNNELHVNTTKVKCLNRRKSLNKLPTPTPTPPLKITNPSNYGIYTLFMCCNCIVNVNSKSFSVKVYSSTRMKEELHSMLLEALEQYSY